MMVIPNVDQIAAAVKAVKRAHKLFGYRRPLREDYINTVVWAAVLAVILASKEVATEEQK